MTVLYPLTRQTTALDTDDVTIQYHYTRPPTSVRQTAEYLLASFTTQSLAAHVSALNCISHKSFVNFEQTFNHFLFYPESAPRDSGVTIPSDCHTPVL